MQGPADEAPTSNCKTLKYKSSEPKNYRKSRAIKKMKKWKDIIIIAHTTGTTSGTELDFGLSSMGTFRMRKNSTYASS